MSGEGFGGEHDHVPDEHLPEHADDEQTDDVGADLGTDDAAFSLDDDDAESELFAADGEALAAEADPVAAWSTDDGLEDWLADEPQPAPAAEPGTVGALSDVEVDSLFGASLADPPAAPSADELVDWALRERTDEG